MKKTTIFIVMALLCLNFQLKAQNQDNPEIQIGQSIPDLKLINPFGAKEAARKTSDLKGKVIIIDFWASWCAPCISAFAHNEILQEKFKGKVQFINIGYESDEVVKNIYSRIYPSGKTGFIWLGNDKIFVKMFPHTYLPHYVWIDAKGNYVAATEGKGITEENISLALAGNFSKLKQKTDKASLPLTAKNQTNEETLFESTLSKYKSGGRLNFIFYPGDSILGRRGEMNNTDILSLYRHAYRKLEIFNETNTKLEVNDREKLTTNLSGQDYREWLESGNGFSWRVKVPIDHNLETFMQGQLPLLFPQYSATISTLEQPALVLVRTSELDKMKSNGGLSSNKFSAFGAILKNVPLKALMNQLKAKYMQDSKYTILDETGYMGAVDMTLDGNLSDTTEVNKALEAYDLKLVKKNSQTKVLIIKDTASSSHSDVKRKESKK